MPVIPFRNLAQQGILFDPSPYELPPNAWSNGSNVRFAAGRAMRAPVWKLVEDSLSDTPIFATAYRPSNANDQVIYVGATGRAYAYANGAVTEATPTAVAYTDVTNGGSGYSTSAPPAVTFSAPTVSGGSAATGTAVVNASGAVTGITITNAGKYPVGSAVPTVTIAAPSSGTTAAATASLAYTPAPAVPEYTSAFLGAVLYLNVPNQIPWYLPTNSTTFLPMPNWNPVWSCRVLRTFGDYLVALNVTKNGVPYPTMWKSSDTVLAGGPPDSWDSTNVATNAYENIIEGLESPIVDGLALGNSFVVYASNQVFLVQQTGNQELFSFTRIFSEGGLIAPNCVVEVDGKHYVFGSYDIYVHDGTSKQSLAENRVKEYIFSNLNTTLSNRFFVTHMPQTNEIMFAYVSGEASSAFPGTVACNRGAVYNYAQNTWGFVDCPNLVAAGIADFQTQLEWATSTPVESFSDLGGSWYTLQDPYRTQVFGVSASSPGLLTHSRVLLYDFMNKGTAPYPYIAEPNATAFLERVGLDLDIIGGDQPSELAMYKIAKRVFPQVSIFGGVPASIYVGAQLTPSAPVNWQGPFSFDPTRQYKVDMRVGGRYLAFRVTVPQASDFEVAGLDVDVASQGAR